VGIVAAGGSYIQLNGVVNFGACDTDHVSATTGGQVIYNNTEVISGGAARHFRAHNGGTIRANEVGVTIIGTPAFSDAYASSG
jgi:hypothetical protein